MLPPGRDPRRPLAVAVVLVAALLGALVVAVRMARQLDDARGLVEHTLLVQRDLEATLAAVVDVETGARGFVITGDRVFLEPYHRGLVESQQRLARLRGVVLSPGRQERLARVTELLQLQRGIAQAQVDLRLAGRTGEAYALVGSGRGKAAMDAVREAIGALRTEVAGLLLERSAVVERARRRSAAAFSVPIVLLAAAVLALASWWRRTLRERAALQRRLVVSDRLAAVGALAGGIGHEINNPLSYILTNLGFAEESLAGPGLPDATRAAEVVEALRDARQGALRVRDIVTELRAIARDGGQPDRLDLRDVVARTLRLASGELRDVRVERDLRDTAPVLGGPARLAQLVLHLVGNAARAVRARGEGRVRVATVSRDGWAVLEVEDDGAGIPPHHLRRVFDPFFTTQEPGGARGLGLSVCDAVAREMGGRIDVDSVPGRGTVFRVFLPRAGDEPAAKPAAPERGTAAA